MSCVLLWERAVNQQAIQQARALVHVTDADRRADETSGDAIMDPALGMGVDRHIISVWAEGPEKPQRLELALLHQITLIDPVDVRVALEDVLGARP